MAVILPALSLALLLTNNQAWTCAGQEANRIRQGLETFYKETPGDPQVMLVGLPDETHGAYVCRNALWGMTKSPQLSRDITNCLMVNQFEPVLPFGFLKHSLLQSRNQVRVARWDAKAGQVSHACLERGGRQADTQAEMGWAFA